MADFDAEYEYKVAGIIYEFSNYRSNDENIALVNERNLTNLLNAHARDGWEFVAIDKGYHENERFIIFRRLREEDEAED